MALTHEKSVQRLFKLPESLNKALQEFAFANNTSDSDIVRKAIAAYIGIDDPTLHGNTKYTSDAERVQARRARQKARRDLAREVLKLVGSGSGED
jgi:hypothetical protein